MSTDDSIWERAEEIVRDRIANGGPCVNRLHFERLVEEKYQELVDETEEKN